MTASNIIAPQFSRPARGRLRLLDGYRGLYQYENEAGFYIRPVVDRRQVLHKLSSHTPSAADRERGRLIAQLAQYRAGLARNPFALEVEAITLRDLAAKYLAADCPRKKAGKPRSPAELQAERRRVALLSAWPRSRQAAAALTAEDWRAYRDWRLQHFFMKGEIVKRPAIAGGGLRAIDKERVTVSNMFHFGMRHHSDTGITANPIIAAANLDGSSFETFKDPDSVVHCREHMPRSGDELHALARFFFNGGRRRHVFGWLALFSARIGQRSHEMIRLRIDARDETCPGFRDEKKRKLYLFRSSSSKGTYGHVDVDKPFRLCLEAHRAWLRLNYPTSPWYFPSPEDPSLPVHRTSLTHALAGAAAAMGLPHRTAHGLRAFRVNVLRSEGKSLDEAALLVGQKSRGKLIVDVYGEGLAEPITWLPHDGAPAWEEFSSGAERYVQTELGL